MPPFRLAALASHPIQYQAPLFRALAARPEIELHVFFCERWGLRNYRDPGFRAEFSWDIPLLGGYRFSFLRNLNPFPNPSSFWSCLNPGIVPAVRSGRFDALWIHGWALASNWISLAAAPSRLPILLRAETNGLAEPAGLRKAVKRILLAHFFGRISAFLAIGTRNAAFYRSYRIPSERIFWTPYAVDNEFFIKGAQQLSAQKALLREKEGIPPNLPVILFCGKLSKQKCPADLLKAFAILSRFVKASLVFVGDGPLRLRLRHLAEKGGLSNVFFLGFRNQSQMPSCYAMADVLVLPSAFEPWGLVVNEAMCCGLAVIASDRVGAAVDLVKEGDNGFTYPAGDGEALADRLQKVLGDAAESRRMGQRSLEIIRPWGIREEVAGLIQALRSVVPEGA